MRKTRFFFFLFLIILSGCSLHENDIPEVKTDPPSQNIIEESTPKREENTHPEAEKQKVIPEKALGGEEFITYISSTSGDTALLVRLPEKPRYDAGAPILVIVPTFFTELHGFHDDYGMTSLEAITITPLWPGIEDKKYNAKSEGTFDYGGPDSIEALRDTIRFALGELKTTDGYTIDAYMKMTPLIENVGVYAFSHPGIAATNVFALHGKDIANIKYFVGRENPTFDAVSAMEIGYLDEEKNEVLNPFYNPEGYSPTKLEIDYSSIDWIQDELHPDGIPVFRNENGEDHILSEKCPRMWDKRFYSISLTQALYRNDILSLDSWPDNVATPEEAREIWPFRNPVMKYQLIKKNIPNLKVMLVFGQQDHVQSAPDKPHIHQAYDGFAKTAELWTRLNPDEEYGKLFLTGDQTVELPDNNANSEPEDWLTAYTWGYRNRHENEFLNKLIPNAAVSEMMDRVQYNNWDENLEARLH